MELLGKVVGKWWFVLLGALLCSLLYWGMATLGEPQWRYFTPVISTVPATFLPALVKTTTVDSNAATAIVLTASNVISSVVDSTEDYKALGYTDNRKIVRDDKDNLYVAYRKKWQGTYRIFIAKSTDQGQRWTVLNGKKPVETMGDYTQRVPSLAVSRNAKDDGNFLHLVWYGNDNVHVGNERQIKYLRLTTSGKLSSDGCCAAQFNIAGYADEELWQEHPAIYTNGSNVYIVWEGRDITTPNAKVKFVGSTDFGRTWSPPRDIVPSDTINFSRPTLAVTYQAKTRQLFVVAYGEDKGIGQIYWNRSLDNGAQWASWQPVAPTTTDQRHVSIARDDADNLHIVWREEATDSTDTVLRYRVFNPTLAGGAGDWQAAPATIAAQPGRCLFFPSVAVDENKRVWVAWTESTDCHTVPSDDPVSGQIAYRVKSAAGKWGNPIYITPGDHQLYASLRSSHAPDAAAMDLVWLDVSHCVSGDEAQSPPEQTASDSACLIHYTSLK